MSKTPIKLLVGGAALLAFTSCQTPRGRNYEAPPYRPATNVSPAEEEFYNQRDRNYLERNSVKFGLEFLKEFKK